jgi:hypothetical protein
VATPSASDLFFGGSTGRRSSTNITPALISRGLPATQSIDLFYDFNPAFGGPIIRDHVWFFSSWRRIVMDNKTGGTYLQAQGSTPSGAPAIDDQWMHNGSARVTFQVTSKNQLTLYDDRNQKGQRHDMTDVLPPEAVPYGIDPATAAAARNPRLYYVSYAKWTSTVTNKLLLETGLTLAANNYKIISQPGYTALVGSPTYFTTIPKVDIIQGTLVGAPGFTPQTIDVIDRDLISNMTYATGSHTFKTGFQ